MPSPDDKPPGGPRNTGSQAALRPSAPRNTGSQPALQPGSPRNTGSQAALRPSAPRGTGSQAAHQPGAPRSSGSHQAHQPNTEPNLKDTTPATRSPLAPGGEAGPRPSNPNLRRPSNGALPAVGGPRASAPGARPADVGNAPTSPGHGARAAQVDVSTDTGVPPRPLQKKGSRGRVVAFSLAMVILFGAGAVWVVLHPERFPQSPPEGAKAATGPVQPPPQVRPPPPQPPPAVAEAKPEKPPPAEEDASADLAAPGADDGKAEKDDKEEKSAPGAQKKPSRKVRHLRAEAKAEEHPEPAPAPEPKPEKPAPTPQQLKDGLAHVEGLLAKRESIHGPDPVLREFFGKVKAEVAGADTDEQKRAAGNHLSELQRQLSR